jgi:GNAT superfamily N-acetyltransferase
MTVGYRLATADDAEALAELGVRTFTDTFGHLYQPGDLEIFLQNHSPENWDKELSDPAFEVCVAEQGGTLVGYVKLGPPHLPFEPRGEAAELRQLYVVEEAKGKGVADALIQWVIERAPRLGCRQSLPVGLHRKSPCQAFLREIWLRA